MLLPAGPEAASRNRGDLLVFFLDPKKIRGSARICKMLLAAWFFQHCGVYFPCMSGGLAFVVFWNALLQLVGCHRHALSSAGFWMLGCLVTMGVWALLVGCGS